LRRRGLQRDSQNNFECLGAIKYLDHADAFVAHFNDPNVPPRKALSKLTEVPSLIPCSPSRLAQVGVHIATESVRPFLV
jgi:hypothetical protein